MKYSTFDRELLAAYQAVRHFRNFVEVKPFTLYTDHKPLTFALSNNVDRSPRPSRHLLFIAEFTSDIRHVKGKFNVVADTLSRINTVPLPPIDFRQLANDQAASQEIAAYRTSITNLFLRDIPFSDVSLLCDMSLGKPRLVLPKEWTYIVFQTIHSLAHAGPRPTQRAIPDHYVWHGLKRDIYKMVPIMPELPNSQSALPHPSPTFSLIPTNMALSRHLRKFGRSTFPVHPRRLLTNLPDGPRSFPLSTQKHPPAQMLSYEDGSPGLRYRQISHQIEAHNLLHLYGQT